MDILKEWRIATGSLLAVLLVTAYLFQDLREDPGVFGAVFVYLIAATPLFLLPSQKRIRKKIATGKLNSFHIYFQYFMAAMWSVFCIFKVTRELTAVRISVLPIPAAVFIFAIGRMIWLRLSVKRGGTPTDTSR